MRRTCTQCRGIGWFFQNSGGDSRVQATCDCMVDSTASPPDDDTDRDMPCQFCERPDCDGDCEY